MQLDARRWDLQGAAAGGAAAELETWSVASYLSNMIETTIYPEPLSKLSLYS